MLEIFKYNKFRKDKIRKRIIEKNLKTLYIGRSISIADKIDSTNNWAKREIENGCINGKIFIAEQQESGRGRSGNRWNSRGYKDILMTVVLDYKNQEIPNVLTLIAGLSVQKAIAVLLDCDVLVKWPNDIFIDGKKVCGILCESIKRGGENRTIIGIGINVNGEIFSDEIKDIATSLYLSTGKNVRRESLVAQILNFLEEILKYSNDSIIKEYKKVCLSIGKEAEIIYVDKEIKGRIVDLSNSGNLLIKCENNEVIEINSINKIRQKIQLINSNH